MNPFSKLSNEAKRIVIKNDGYSDYINDNGLNKINFYLLMMRLPE